MKAKTKTVAKLLKSIFRRLKFLLYFAALFLLQIFTTIIIYDTRTKTVAYSSTRRDLLQRVNILHLIRSLLPVVLRNWAMQQHDWDCCVCVAYRCHADCLHAVNKSIRPTTKLSKLNIQRLTSSIRKIQQAAIHLNPNGGWSAKHYGQVAGRHDQSPIIIFTLMHLNQVQFFTIEQSVAIMTYFYVNVKISVIE